MVPARSGKAPFDRARTRAVPPWGRKKLGGPGGGAGGGGRGGGAGAPVEEHQAQEDPPDDARQHDLAGILLGPGGDPAGGFVGPGATQLDAALEGFEIDRRRRERQPRLAERLGHGHPERARATAIPIPNPPPHPPTGSPPTTHRPPTPPLT